jgi:hypothetical protein
VDLRELPARTPSRHPWEIARARFFVDLIAGRAELARSVRIIDVGAGDGFLAQRLIGALPAGSTIVCFDPQYTVEQIRDFSSAAAPASLTFVREVPRGPYDLLLLMDVLEHVADDSGMLSRVVSQHLADQALVALSVPSGPWLYTQHDVSLGHLRRYGARDFDRLLVNAGLHVETRGGLFHGLLVARAGQKLWEVTRGVRSRPTVPLADHQPTAATIGIGGWRQGHVLTAAIGAALALDTRVSTLFAGANLTVPGLSLWALCSRR